jgi:cell division protein FtsL
MSRFEKALIVMLAIDIALIFVAAVSEVRL